MGMVSRDWCCLNSRCGSQFHSFDDHPECPKCGCVRVHWIPGGGHIGKLAPRMDRTVRSLASDFGFTNLNSPSASRLNRGAPRADHPGPQRRLGEKTFGMGLGIPGITANVYDKCSSEPATAPTGLKGTSMRIGDNAPRFTRGAGSFPGPSDNAVVHYRHRPAS
jgi:hypothetical protein